MRDPNRLNYFYSTMKVLHQACFPDLRFGQLMSNFFDWLMGSKGVDLFFPEENKMLEYFREYCKENSQYFDTTNYEDCN